MKKPYQVLKILEKYRTLVDREIKLLLRSCGNLPMYDMMAYFFGYKNECFVPISGYGGKHFRSGLCLLLADSYKLTNALPVATAIEIFHNFTLIHDDIEDKDPIRRGRPTVWKIWGINHGINTGDAQLILANLELLKAKEAICGNDSVNILEYVNRKFLEVAEGQFLDFELTAKGISDSDVNEKNYLEMITKKSGVLVGCACSVVGMLAKKEEKEIKALWDYGLNLGLAYQLNDDIASIWGKKDRTGKEEYKDIIERKKTLPIIRAYQELNVKDKKKFAKIFDKSKNLDRKEVAIIKGYLRETGARIYAESRMNYFFRKSLNALNRTSLKNAEKKVLRRINYALIPTKEVK